MTLEEKYLLASDVTWRGRCTTAGVQAATQVMAEAPTTSGHDLRAAYANKVLLNPATHGGPIAMATAAQPGISGPEASDSDIQFTINSLWDALSGNSPSAAGRARS